MPQAEWPMRGVDNVRKDTSDGLATGPFGSSVSAKFFRSEGVPLIRGSNLSEAVGERLIEDNYVFVSEEKAAEFPRAVARPGDLVFTCWGTIGQVGLIDGRARFDRYLISNKQMKLSPDPAKADSLFLYYLFKSPDLQAAISSVGIGSSVPGFNLGQLRGLRFPLPPLPEQQAIAAVLGTLDDKIEQNRRTGRALEGLARATFKAWFVDFEPVKAKVAGQTSFPGMPSAAFAALPERLTDSALGPMPQGWELRSVGDLVTLYKQQINPQDHADESFEHFSIPAFDAGQNPVIEPGGGIKSQKFVVVPRCILLSKLNPRIARVWLPSHATDLRQIASTEFLVVVPKAGWVRETIYCLFQQEDFRKSLAQSASGTSNSHQRVRPADLLTRPLVVPSQPILDAFAEQVVPQMALRDALQQESKKLTALRDYLLPRLLSGRVRVQASQVE